MSEGAEGVAVKRAAQYLLVALLGVGVAFVPAYSHAPIMTPKQKQEFLVAQLPPKDYARYLLKSQYKDPQKQYRCLTQLWGKESGWNYRAKSPTHDYGIPQRHMKHNTPAQIRDFMKHPHTQIKWGLTYIEHRYDTPCGALRLWLSRSKNGKGGWY